MIIEGPFLHEANTLWPDAVNDEGGIIEAAEILTQQRVAVPDLLQQCSFRNDVRHTRDANLVVMIVEIAKLDFWIGGDLDRFVIHPQIGDINGEAIGLDRR